MLKISCLLLALIVLFPLPLFSVSDDIVINSYRVSAPGKTTDEFIELYNRSTVSVEITGWKLSKKTVSGKIYDLVKSFPDAVIRPGESILVGHKDSTDPIDIFYTSGNSISEDNTIVLERSTSGFVLDQVGFGKATFYEGSPAPKAGTDVWARYQGRDSDNNLADFKKVIVGNSDYTGICLSELMPGPENGDEWIEIYNAESTKDIGGLVIADKLGSVKKFTVPQGTVLEEGKYHVFFKKQTGITLNDSGDGVVLIDQTGKIMDDTGASFGKVTKGYSYASDGAKWHWTNHPTPGSGNRIMVPAGKITSKKRKNGETEIIASSKGLLPSVEVERSDQDTPSVKGERSDRLSENDRILGRAMIVVAIIGGLIYTIYNNKEKLIELLDARGARNSRAWRKIVEKIQKR